jgi:hypothetical protein
MKFAIAAMAACLAFGAAAPVAAQEASCAPVMGLSFVCGVQKPEDLVQIPGTKWILASGMTEGGGLNIIDADARTVRALYTGAPAQIRQDKKLYPDCPAPPEVAKLNTHGLGLRAKGGGLYTLYAVSHGALESILVFALDARGAEPAISFTGCVPMPAGHAANSVAGYSDGTIIATVPARPGFTGPDFMSGGRVTGAVFEWKPGTSGFRLLPGTELPGDNGIEISKDEKEFYVAVSGTQSVVVYDRAKTAMPLRQSRTPWFNLDNIHWSGDRLIAAGMMFDEPACGGTRKQIIDRKGDLTCHRGWVAGQIDPVSMGWTILGYGEPNPAFGGIATALVVGDTLWLSSYQADRAAYRPLPHPR